MVRLLAFLFLVILNSEIYGQDRTVGLVAYDPSVSDGYTLITSHHNTSTYLIDNCGNVVHEWTSDYFYGNSVDLLENGLLLRSTRVNIGFLIAGGAGGRVELLDWNSNIVWEMTYATEFYRHHHDAVYLPNGNILILAWDSNNEDKMIQAGLNPDYLGTDNKDFWAEHIIEVRPIGSTDYEIVWEWYLLDHVVQDYDDTKDNYGIIADHPELVDLNYNTDPGNPKWIHANALAYNEELDQIIVNSRNLNEFWIIDHSTTLEEASGHTGGNLGMGGDIIYRYGNPRVYQRGDDADQKFYAQHNPQWIDTDKIMLFNNGNGRNPEYSEVFFIEVPVQNDGSYLLEQGEAYGPANPYLSYSSDDVDGFNYSSFISGVELLDNGNLLICSGPSGTITEINPDGERLWTYVNPLSSEGTLEQGSTLLDRPEVRNLTFRAKKYPPEFPGLAGRELIPEDPIERNPLPSLCENVVSVESNLNESIMLYPNPADERINFQLSPGTIIDQLIVTSVQGRVVIRLKPNDTFKSLDISGLKPGLYFIRFETDSGSIIRKFQKN